MKFIPFRFILLCLVSGSSIHCTRPPNKSVQVDCASNQKKDVNGSCVTTQGDQSGPGPSKRPEWPGSIPQDQLDPANKSVVTTDINGGQAVVSPQEPSATTEQQAVRKVFDEISKSFSEIKSSPTGSSFFILAAPSKTGAYGLTLRSSAKDVKNLSVSYPESSNSFSAATGLSIRADISWEQAGKKCHLENTSFAIANFLKEKPVSAVCE